MVIKMEMEKMSTGKYYYIYGSSYQGVVRAIDLYRNNFEYTNVMQYKTLEGTIGYTKTMNVEREVSKEELVLEWL